MPIKSTAFGLGLFSSLVSAKELQIPIEKDASVIGVSACCGDASDVNFGSRDTVDAGVYYHQADAPFGFDLSPLQASATIRKAELVLGEAFIAGNKPAQFLLSTFASDWKEDEITWKKKPTDTVLFSKPELKDGTNVIDVTEAVRAALSVGQISLNFMLKPNAPSNIFINSKENPQG